MGKNISGLLGDYTAVELIEHCKKRENYHAALSKKYVDKVADALRKKADAAQAMHSATVEQKFEIPDSMTEEEAEESFGGKGAYARVSNAAGNDTAADEAKAKTHRARVKFFQVFGAHIIEGRTYRLGIHDLQTLELV